MRSAVVWFWKKIFVLNSVEKNVLLIAICLLTSLSCLFFCSFFVVAKDLCASSFGSDLKCQRCPFDVGYGPHARQHLCGTPSDCVYVRVCVCVSYSHPNCQAAPMGARDSEQTKTNWGCAITCFLPLTVSHLVREVIVIV